MLPIEPAIPDLRRVLRDGTSAVLQAPPGAGKTTVVPLALVDEPWLAPRRIVMLEPRRLATRAAAWRMAESLGEQPGGRVGYRMRGDTRAGVRTRVEVVTEGILTRMLQRDPTLDGVGLVIFDEFHERSLDADLGLALTLETRSVLRADLRLLVMSATLDGAAVARLLGDAPIVAAEGRAFPVETRYVGQAARRDSPRVEGAVVGAVRRALREDEGDILVFLPGVAEIRRVHALLVEGDLPRGVEVLPLHGTLSRDDQDRAIRASAPGVRKVVLATAIAETSLTIDGVRVVVDSGLSRVPRFSPRSGMTRLETVRVSRPSADQRRGRAGRLGPGICYRLWSEHEEHHLLARSTPEILEADLAPLALELAAAGVPDPASLRWIDPPPPAAYAQARELLVELGALRPAGSSPSDVTVTPHGRRMAELPMHPRLAHMILAAESLGVEWLACDLAALLGERDPLRSDGETPPDADVGLRLALLRERGGSAAARDAGPGLRVDLEALRRIRAEAQRLREQLRVPGGGVDARAGRSSTGQGARDATDHAGLLLAFAYPDRLAQLRVPRSGRFLLRNGNGAALVGPQTLSDSPFLVVADLDGRRPESRIFLAAGISLEDIEAHLADQIVREREVGWDARERGVVARERERLGAIVLAERPARDVEPETIVEALLDGIRREGVAALPWSEAARKLRQRLAFLRRIDGAWPDVSDTALADSAGDWLAPWLRGERSIGDLTRVDFTSALMSLLTWEQRSALDELAPTHVTVPSGSRIPIDYGDPGAPVLAVRLQEMFGLAETPRIARGRVPLTLHLLSPAHRPVQVTKDLASFWRSSYFDVRKDLRGRYPKHHWPEDPMQAEPTRKAKKRQ